MKIKLIQTGQYLLLINEGGLIGRYVWDKEAKYIRENVSRFNVTDYDVEVIAYYPLQENSPKLDLPLLPNPFKNKDIKELASNFATNHYGAINTLKRGFVAGYKAAQKQFSLEEVEKAIEQAFRAGCTLDQTDGNSSDLVATKKYIFQSLFTKRLPKEFVPGFENKPIYTGDGCHEDNWVLEVIDTPQGGIVVGTWVY